MFDTLLTRFSPLATVYNSLVVVKCAFKQFEIKQYAYEDAIQTKQVQGTFNCDPYAGVNPDKFITNHIEDDLMVVDKLMEDVVDDDDYCHLAIETHAPSAAPLVNGAYNLASALAENLARTLICGAVLSCDFVRAERKSLEDFVQEKSNKIARAPIVRSRAQPKMRGFGIDFGDGVPGIKFGLSAFHKNANSRHSSHHHVTTNTHHAAHDVKPTKKINVTANIRFTQELFGIKPTSKMPRCSNQSQVRFQDSDVWSVDDWGLVEPNCTVDSNASCYL